MGIFSLSKATGTKRIANNIKEAGKGVRKEVKEAAKKAVSDFKEYMIKKGYDEKLSDKLKKGMKGAKSIGEFISHIQKFYSENASSLALASGGLIITSLLLKTVEVITQLKTYSILDSKLSEVISLNKDILLIQIETMRSQAGTFIVQFEANLRHIFPESLPLLQVQYQQSKNILTYVPPMDARAYCEMQAIIMPYIKSLLHGYQDGCVIKDINKMPDCVELNFDKTKELIEAIIFEREFTNTSRGFNYSTVQSVIDFDDYYSNIINEYYKPIFDKLLFGIYKYRFNSNEYAKNIIIDIFNILQICLGTNDHDEIINILTKYDASVQIVLAELIDRFKEDIPELLALLRKDFKYGYCEDKERCKNVCYLIFAREILNQTVNISLSLRAFYSMLADFKIGVFDVILGVASLTHTVTNTGLMLFNGILNPRTTATSLKESFSTASVKHVGTGIKNTVADFGAHLLHHPVRCLTNLGGSAFLGASIGRAANIGLNSAVSGALNAMAAEKRKHEDVQSQQEPDEQSNRSALRRRRRT